MPPLNSERGALGFLPYNHKEAHVRHSQARINVRGAVVRQMGCVNQIEECIWVTESASLTTEGRLDPENWSS